MTLCKLKLLPKLILIINVADMWKAFLLLVAVAAVASASGTKKAVAR